MVVIERGSSCLCPCAIFLHAFPFHLCVFALNHLPSIHIEVKLLTQTRLFFDDSFYQAWEIESSEKGTMTGMKIILIERPGGIYFLHRENHWCGFNESLLHYQSHTP